MCRIWERNSKERQPQVWFVRYRSGDFSLKNAQRSGRPVEAMEPTSRPLAIQIVIVQHVQRSLMSRIHALKKLKKLGYAKKLDLWVSHQLKEIRQKVVS
ncbi:hypothetical protein QE152_g9329 [Popillia japonica]|uniref:Uncharacterized protein n=1 Tax=Popillia japonica TaxID=7064 RepID=A0AAW1M1B3_POPJA